MMDILKMKYPYYKIIISESEANALATLHETMKEFCGNQVCNTCPSKDSPLCNLFNLSDFNAKLDSHKLKGEHTLVHSYDSIRQKADKKKVEGHCTYGRLCPKTGGSCRTCSFYVQQPDNKKEDKEPDKKFQLQNPYDMTRNKEAPPYEILKAYCHLCASADGNCGRCINKDICIFYDTNRYCDIPAEWYCSAHDDRSQPKFNVAINIILEKITRQCVRNNCASCFFNLMYVDGREKRCIFKGRPQIWNIHDDNAKIINKVLGKETNTDVDKQPET